MGAVRLVLGNRASLCYTWPDGDVRIHHGLRRHGAADLRRGVSPREVLMPGMFALCATTMGVAAFLNSRIVERSACGLISHTRLLCFIGITGAALP
jgi:hypothetical protein